VEEIHNNRSWKPFKRMSFEDFCLFDENQGFATAVRMKRVKDIAIDIIIIYFNLRDSLSFFFDIKNTVLKLNKIKFKNRFNNCNSIELKIPLL